MLSTDYRDILIGPENDSGLQSFIARYLTEEFSETAPDLPAARDVITGN